MKRLWPSGRYVCYYGPPMTMGLAPHIKFPCNFSGLPLIDGPFQSWLLPFPSLRLPLCECLPVFLLMFRLTTCLSFCTSLVECLFLSYMFVRMSLPFLHVKNLCLCLSVCLSLLIYYFSRMSVSLLSFKISLSLFSLITDIFLCLSVCFLI